MQANSLLASVSSPAFAALEAQKLRALDQDIRLNLQKTRAEAGYGDTVTGNVLYAIAPDGTRYAVDGTVTVTKRSGGSDARLLGKAARAAKLEAAALEKDEASQSSAASSGFQRTRPATLADVFSNKLSLSPLEFALTFSEEFVDDTQRSKLQAADVGVRSQERLHFRAAGGLVAGLPRYGFQEGPDGELYATSGYVNLRPTATANPAKAADDAEIMAIAATAPGDASAADMAVARSAYSHAALSYEKHQPPERLLDMLG